MTMVARCGACGRAGLRWWARLRGHFDILRLITRGFARSLRLLGCCKISSAVSTVAVANCSGGKGRLIGDLAADDS